MRTGKDISGLLMGMGNEFSKSVNGQFQTHKCENCEFVILKKKFYFVNKKLKKSKFTSESISNLANKLVEVVKLPKIE